MTTLRTPSGGPLRSGCLPEGWGHDPDLDHAEFVGRTLHLHRPVIDCREDKRDRNYDATVERLVEAGVLPDAEPAEVSFLRGGPSRW